MGSAYSTERPSMSKSVQVSQKLLFALGSLLLVSLAVAGYLLGRQNALGPVPQLSASPSPRVVPLAEEVEPNIESRIAKLEDRVGTNAFTPRTPQQTKLEQAPKSSEMRQAYFKELNSILGRSALQSPMPMPTRLIDLAMSSDKEGHVESVLAQTTQAAAKVQALEAPPECLEHKTLVLAQLQYSLTLLRELQLALESGDASKLQELSTVDHENLSQADRLRDIDEALRPNENP